MPDEGHINEESANGRTTDSRPNTDSFPDGGKSANLVLLGSFLSITAGLGFENSISIYQAWVTTHQLQHLSDAQVGWIFGIYNFMVFFCGVQIGPIFDACGPRWLILTGTLLFIATFVLLSFCKFYWQILLVIGICGGLATSIIFIVPVACLAHYFSRRRGAVTGIAMSGGSLGGIFFPLAFQRLTVQIGFQWTTQVIGLISLILLLPGCLLIRPRVAPEPITSWKTLALPDPTVLNDRRVVVMAAGVFFLELAFFIGLEYLSAYCLAYGIDDAMSYDMVVFLNVGSFLGRWLPGLLADRLGRFNVLVGSSALCTISMLAIWLPAGGRTAVMIVFAIVFGFGSGSTITLIPVCIAELCELHWYGRTYTVIYTIASFAALIGVPMGGELIKRCNGSYWGLIVFSGIGYVLSTIAFLTVSLLKRPEALQHRF